VRYYELTITNADGQVYQPSPTAESFILGSNGPSFSSLVRPGGNNDPGALNIEIDIPVYAFHTPQGGSRIAIWGVGLRMMAQQNLSGSNFVLKGGMSAGLPLANPAQQGILAEGVIWQAFGNWQGLNQTLEIVCNPGRIDPSSSGVVNFAWPAGQYLEDSVVSSLTGAFPIFDKPVWNVGATLYTPEDIKFQSKSLAQFSQDLINLTQKIGARQISPTYPGLRIAIQNKQFVISDSLDVTGKRQLQLQDLIGQPTWTSNNEITFKTVMRGDIQLFDQVIFPTGVIAPYVLTTPASAIPGAPARQKSVFQGQFFITEGHHWGNFRDQSPDSWVSVFTAVATGVQAPAPDPIGW
jgi:hypothetical protein